nr:putative ribonuclease H-like domain-containing protein [Tanacetum cinerariifolium]
IDIPFLFPLQDSFPDSIRFFYILPRWDTTRLEAYSDSDYAGSHGDRKSNTGGCQFLGRRLISWQCKKQTIVATSLTEAKYVAAASCCGQLLMDLLMALCVLAVSSSYDSAGHIEAVLADHVLISADRYRIC